jgi:Ala-tRNA(Pro) deacylase
MNNFLKRLDDEGIASRVITHQPVWHLDEGLEIQKQCTVVKNLLLKDHKHEHYYLVLTQGDTRLNFKNLANQFNTSRSQLKFADPSELDTTMHVISGMVSPLVLESGLPLTIVIESGLKQVEDLGFHAGTNTETVVLAYQGLTQLMATLGYPIVTLEA